MILFVVDADRYETIVHRVNYREGKYLMPRKLKGSTDEQITSLLKLMRNDEYTKIVFDEFGVGVAISDRFKWRIQHPSEPMAMDMNGNITHFSKEDKSQKGTILND
jgi:hypothetical protein